MINLLLSMTEESVKCQCSNAPIHKNQTHSIHTTMLLNQSFQLFFERQELVGPTTIGTRQTLFVTKVSDPQEELHSTPKLIQRFLLKVVSRDFPCTSPTVD
jgi:hypothetical protein